jgi:hypothetical protein
MAFHLRLWVPGVADSSPVTTHPADEDLAAYLDGILSTADRVRLEGHLSGCEYCRSRVALAVHALKGAQHGRRFSRWARVALAAVAAAAALSGVLLLTRRAVRTAPPIEVRAPEPEAGTPALRIVQPSRGSTVAPSELRFVWRSLGSDVLYQVTVSAVDGRTLWNARTSDTVNVPPPEAVRRLEPGQNYFWRVDALLSNLRSVTSGDQRFEVSAP